MQGARSLPLPLFIGFTLWSDWNSVKTNQSVFWSTQCLQIGRPILPFRLIMDTVCNWRAKKACAPNKWGGGQTEIVGGSYKKKFPAPCTQTFSPSQFFIACSTPAAGPCDLDRWSPCLKMRRHLHEQRRIFPLHLKFLELLTLLDWWGRTGQTDGQAGSAIPAHP